jgi:hypothetical protein
LVAFVMNQPGATAAALGEHGPPYAAAKQIRLTRNLCHGLSRLP